MMLPRRNDFDIFNVFNDAFFMPGESKLMKTDIREKSDKYLIDIALAGYDKENIKISVSNGYLTVSAIKDDIKEEEDTDKFVRKERYTGSCERSFYVGEDICNEDVKASFKNGILSIEVPKINEKKLPDKKYIEIKD